MNKMLVVPLTEVRTNSNDQPIGSLYQEGENIYKFVKNYGSTTLNPLAPCLNIAVGTAVDLGKKVVACDSSASKLSCAGDPVTTIAASGSATGDHGWIQCKGLKRVSIQQITTAIAIGDLAVASAAQTSAWQPLASTPSTNSAYMWGKVAVFMEAVATTGAYTPTSALISIKCL